MKNRRKRHKTVIIFIVILEVLISTLTGISYASAEVIPDVIENYSHNPVMYIDEYDFEQEWNGIVDDYLFDAMFTDKDQLNSFEFEILSSDLDCNMVRTGFWINAIKKDDNNITGYMVMINPLEETNISLLYLEDVDIAAFPAGDLPEGCTTLEVYDETGTAFMNEWSDMHFRVETSGSSFQVYMTNDGQTEVELFNREIPLGTNRGFGLYTLHDRLNCNASMHTWYGNVYVDDVSAMEVTAQVNFKLSGTETSVAESQIMKGLSGGEYKIIPPDIKGFCYTGASRDLLDPLVYNENPDDNITDLFYIAETTSNYRAASPSPEDSGFENMPLADSDFENTPPEDSGFEIMPPEGPDITKLFHLVKGVGSSFYNHKFFPNVVVITPDEDNQLGGVWAKERLDLNVPFKIKMLVYLGHANGKDGPLADGMTFTLHNDDAGLNAIGGRGEGLGAYTGRIVMEGEDKTDGKYLRNSLCIEFDTFSNDSKWVFDPKDPSYEDLPAHCSLVIPNGDYIHVEQNDYYCCHMNTYFFMPSQEWIEFKVEWKPNLFSSNGGGVLKYTFGGKERKYKIDSINEVFGGSKVYWGFTGATGEHSSLQAVALSELPIQSTKKVSELSEAGIGGTAVKFGDKITYDINFVNNVGKKASLIITDTLPDGLEYIYAKDENGNVLTAYTKVDQTIEWKLPNMESGTSGTVTIAAKVIENADVSVINRANFKWRYEGGSLEENDYAENPVIPTKAVTINYVDRNGEAIQETVTDWVIKNTDYTYTVPDITGYEFDAWVLNNKEQEGVPVTSFKVTDNTEITLIYTKKISTDFIFYKVNMANTSEVLSGAEFKLYLWESTDDAPEELVPKNLAGSGWKLINTQTSAESVHFENLNPGLYQLVETKAPLGYQLPLGQWRFEINNKGEITILPCVGEYKPPAIKECNIDDIPYCIGNVAQYSLPEMGGSNVIWYTVGGIVLLVIAGGLAAGMFCHRHRNSLE